MFALRLANALAADHEVMLAVMHGELVEPGLRAALSPDVRLETLRLPCKRWWFRADTLLRRAKIDRSLVRSAQRRWLTRLVEAFAPDIVHTHLLKADLLALDVRSAGGNKFRHVATMHGDYAPFLQGQADPQLLGVEAAIRSVLARTDAVVAICEDHRRFLLGVDPAVAGKLELIVNGYTPSAAGSAPSLASSDFRFGMVSRGVKLKGWDVAIEAIGLLNRPGTSLVLVGDGPRLAELAAGPLPENVVLAGATGHPLRYIEQFDVALLPTLFPHESLPTVIIEYLVCGKPVIATDVGEIAAMLTAPDGSRAGLLLDFADGQVSASQLAEHMAALMDDPERRRAMSGTALLAAERFAMERCRAAYVALYERLLSLPSNDAISANH